MAAFVKFLRSAVIHVYTECNTRQKTWTQREAYMATTICWKPVQKAEFRKMPSATEEQPYIKMSRISIVEQLQKFRNGLFATHNTV
ncbi:hypothetical protein TNCV_3214221 [Trichonephila clavipes]|nr:hypothetical protein TNCV_3214221 [Trichonephila clavipes]